MTAKTLLEKRFAALEQGDYATLHATYHPDSPFLQQFSDRATYIHFAEQNLHAIKVLSWQSLRQRQIDSQQQEHLLVMELEVDGESQYFYELALLIKTGTGWLYHSAQKLSGEDFAGPAALIDFRHFDQAEEKIRY